MKYIIIAILFVICLVVGYTFFNKYNKRKKFFKALIMLAEKLTVEINFSRERLKVLIENFDKTTKQNLLGIDEGFLNYLDRKTELNDKEIFKKTDVLKKEEKDFILLFLKTLGRSDVENQTKEIANFTKRFEEFKAVSDVEYKKYGTLSLKLSLIAGLFFVIVLI